MSKGKGGGRAEMDRGSGGDDDDGLAARYGRTALADHVPADAYFYFSWAGRKHPAGALERISRRCWPTPMSPS